MLLIARGQWNVGETIVAHGSSFGKERWDASLLAVHDDHNLAGGRSELRRVTKNTKGRPDLAQGQLLPMDQQIHFDVCRITAGAGEHGRCSVDRIASASDRRRLGHPAHKATRIRHRWQRLANQPPSALKVFGRQETYERERDCYRRLLENGVRRLAGFDVPELLDYDNRHWAIEMTIVSPPCVLDFGKAYVDLVPGYTPEALTENCRAGAVHG